MMCGDLSLAQNTTIDAVHRALRSSEVRMLSFEKSIRDLVDKGGFITFSNTLQWRKAMMRVHRMLATVHLEEDKYGFCPHDARRAENAVRRLTLDLSKWMIEMVENDALANTDFVKLDRKLKRTLGKLALALGALAEIIAPGTMRL